MAMLTSMNASDLFTTFTVPTVRKLRAHNVRPTRQRVQIGCLLFHGADIHVSPDQLVSMLESHDIQMSLGTVYNTLRQFADAGLIKEVAGMGDRLVYDTNLSSHHHFVDVDTGELIDIDAANMQLNDLPHPPKGFILDGVDITIRIRR